MIYLLLTIFLNALLIVAFKVFDKFRIDNLQAIVVNYWVCVITGCIFIGEVPFNKENLSQPWFPWSVLMGIGFVSIFNLIAYSTKKDGITITSIANKLSLVIPVAFAIWLYDDKMTVMKIAGILLAFPAVYLSTKPNGAIGTNRVNPWIAILLFFASGLLDTLVNFVAVHFFNTHFELTDNRNQSLFLIHTFGMAGVVGTLVIGSLWLIKGKAVKGMNIIAGICLGVPNYFSLYCFVKLLQSGFLPGSAAIPINNIGVVLSASLMAILFFKERTSMIRLIGMSLSIISILLILLSEIHA